MALASVVATFIVLPLQASAAGDFSYDTYFTSAYERQIDSRTCVAASTAMMLNILSGRDLNLNQMTVLRYAQAHDALNDATQRGSDPLGWATGGDALLAVHDPADDVPLGGLLDRVGGAPARGDPDHSLRQGGRAARPARPARGRHERLHVDPTTR